MQKPEILVLGNKQFAIINGDLATVMGPAQFSGEIVQITVPTEGLKRWANDGVLIQSALPMVPAEVRNFLLCGIIPADWEEIFPHDLND